jgi:hypothetical protein
VNQTKGVAHLGRRSAPAPRCTFPPPFTADFFEEAFIDADGALAPSDGWCKQGVDIAYDGTWVH